MTSTETFDQKVFFKNCRQLIKQQKHQEARRLLSSALRRTSLDNSGILKAGRMAEGLSIDKHTRVSIYGQCTTAWLVPALQSASMAQDEAILIEDHAYDNVIQGLTMLESNIDVLILLPWHQRLFAPGDRSGDQRISEELSFWQQAWAIAKQKSNARIVQIGYDWIDAGASGQYLAGKNDGEVGLTRTLNQIIRENLPESSYFIDLEQISGITGRQEFYDARSYFWTKQPFSEAGLISLSKYVWAGIRAAMVGPKKVLVLDLDNTLWGGIVGEVGAQGIELGDNPVGEAFRSFQQLVKQISDNGCLLAISSKNNERDAREPFEVNQDMVLSLEDFAAFKAGWESKSKVIQEISKELNLGLDSFVFFDDSPMEREEVRYLLPEVEVVEVPVDPSEYRKALLDGAWFESLGITIEDKRRGLLYRQERIRADTRSQFNSSQDYLRSLEMKADVRPLDTIDIERTIQLIGKTNQFNLTSRRHSREETLSFIAKPRAIGLTLRLSDKFGDYGLSSLVLAGVDDSLPKETLVIDTWLMSCRVIGRTVEHFLFNQLMVAAKKAGFKCIRGEYIPGRKNSIVKAFYPEMGFDTISIENNINETLWYELCLDRASEATTCVTQSSNND